MKHRETLESDIVELNKTIVGPSLITNNMLKSIARSLADIADMMIKKNDKNDNFAEWLSTDRFHCCKCSACNTVFSEEMFYDNPPFQFCPWCGKPMKVEGNDEGGNGKE